MDVAISLAISVTVKLSGNICCDSILTPLILISFMVAPTV
jgi:hypothetical protein